MRMTVKTTELTSYPPQGSMSGELVSLEIEAITDPGYCVKTAMEHKEQRGVTIEVTGGIVNRDLLEKLVLQMASMVEESHRTKLKAKLDQLVDTLELSIITKNRLEAAKIKYIGELVLKTDNEMLKIPQFGRKCLKEVKIALAKIDMAHIMHIQWQRPDGK